MSSLSPYKQILRYVDELNDAVSALAVAVEQQLDERGYVALPSAGPRCNWYLRPHVSRGADWRLRMVTRFYVPSDRVESTTDRSVCLQILLDAESDFVFPTVLCAVVEHMPLTESEIYSNVWSSQRIAALHTAAAIWRPLREERGWGCVAPTYKTAIVRLKGYLLNLYDIDRADKARDNIVEPLTGADAVLSLTVPKYVLPVLRA